MNRPKTQRKAKENGQCDPNDLEPRGRRGWEFWFALTSAVNFTFGIDVFNVTNEGTELSRLRDVTSLNAFFLNDNISPRIYRMGVRLGWK